MRWRTSPHKSRPAYVSQDSLIPPDLALGIIFEAAANGERLSPAVKAALKYYNQHGRLAPKFLGLVKRAGEALATKYPHAKRMPLSQDYFAKPLPNGIMLALTFPSDDARVRKQIKKIPGATFDRSTKKWLVPLRSDVCEQLEELGFFVPEHAFELAKQRAEYPKVHPAELNLPKWYLRKLLPYQRLGVAFIESRGGRVLLNDEMGLGKAQPVWAKVRTPSGWKEIGALKKFDVVFDGFGEKCQVIDVYPQGKKRIFKIVLEDGSYTHCTEDHLWVVSVNGEERVLSTKEIIALFESEADVYIPACKPIKHEGKFDPFDPFLFGALLVAGSVLEDDTIWIACDSQELAAKLKKAASPFCHVDATLLPHSGRWRLQLEGSSDTLKYLVLLLRRRRVVPFLYECRPEDRQAFLDGALAFSHEWSQGGVLFSTKRTLLEDIAAIARSLGYCAKLKSNHITNGLFIWKSKGKRIINVEDVGEDEAVCIAVTSPTRTYITDDYIVTHNTIQALAWCEAHPKKRPVLIVCPASAKYNWAEEIKKWSLKTPAIYVIEGMFSKGSEVVEHFVEGDEESENTYVIINYDILGERKLKVKDGKGKEKTILNPGWVSELALYDFEILIVDECHKVKNFKAARSKAVYSLGRKCDHVIAMSGTPILNGPHEFYPILKLVDPTIVPSYEEFIIRYCGAKKTPWGLKVGKPTNVEELHKLLTSTVMLRRRKAEVLKDLPEKIRTAIPFRLKDMGKYLEAVKAFAEWAETMGIESEKDVNAVVLAQLAKLRSIVAELKLPQVIDWISTFLESDQKLIVFGHHQKVLEAIYRHFKSMSVLLYGKVRSAKERQKIRDKFQEDPNIRLFVGNFHAAGEAITLTAASHVCFVELDWVPGVLAQAEDRAHRIGQKYPVNVWYLIAKGTVDELLADRVIFKHGTISQVLDGKEEAWFDRTALLSIVKDLLTQAKSLS